MGRVYTEVLLAASARDAVQTCQQIHEIPSCAVEGRILRGINFLPPLMSVRVSY